MNILLVDDSETSLLLLETMLCSIGYTSIASVSSARKALELLCGDADGSAKYVPDLIIMDVMMPEMDGIEATRQIKLIQAFQDIPIVVITADGRMDRLAQAFDVGATDFISKPINKVELRGRVGSVLRMKQEMDKRKEREAVLLDLTQRLEEANAELQRISGMDGLTGIANRRHFDQIFAKEWLRQARSQQPLSIMMIDIDFFKNYNDTYGHVEGDNCLRKVAETIAATLKRPADLVARYGGEEFVVLLPNTDLGGAAVLGRTIQDAVRKLGISHSKSVSSQVSLSIGVACVLPNAHMNSMALIESADQALYHAKESGRNRLSLMTERNETYC